MCLGLLYPESVSPRNAPFQTVTSAVPGLKP
jgi:hypothetical protein